MKRFSRLFKSEKRRRQTTKEDDRDNEALGTDVPEPPKPKSILKNTGEQEENTENINREAKHTHFGEAYLEETHKDPTNMSSGKWRKDGNKHYTSATPDLCTAVREERLKKALQCYYKALEFAVAKDEYASAAKNYALTSWRLGDIIKGTGQVIMMHHHYKEAVKHFVKAQEAGEMSMSEEWKGNIGTRLQECVQNILEGSLSLVGDTRKKIHMIDGYKNQLSENHKLLPDIYLFMTEIIFGGSVVAVASGEYKDALNLIREANFPLEEAKKLGGDRLDMLDELAILEQDLYYQHCAAESMQACVLGDELLKRAIIFDEPINIDLIWDVIDWYKQGIMLTREKEVELEAIALSKLGSVYHKVLKMPQRAKDNYLRCVQLAMSLHPRTFDDDEWFKEAKRILEVYQEKVKREEDSKHQQERAKYLEELKDELTKLKQYEKDEDVAFLKFVYVTWPPKRKDFKMEDPATIKEHDQKKKALQKAVIHYHPDKVDVEEHGMKWKVLCEEIAKILTRKYESYK